eukprot:scaffold10700_cov108-Cylindrotheca_fusiformis.AAC.10
MPEEKRNSVKDLRGAWESKTRASAESALYSPNHAGKPAKNMTINMSEEKANKSTRQTIKDLSLFASPRVVQNVLDVKSKVGKLPNLPSESNRKNSRVNTEAKLNHHEMIHESDNAGSTTSTSKVTIRDRVKLFDAGKEKGEQAPPQRNGKRTTMDKFYPSATSGIDPQKMRGRRTSVLDRFPPATTTKTPPFKQVPAAPVATTTAPGSSPFGTRRRSYVPPPVSSTEESKPKTELFGRHSLKPVTRHKPSIGSSSPAEPDVLEPETKAVPTPTLELATPEPTTSNKRIASNEPPTPEPTTPKAVLSPEKRKSKKSSKIDREAMVLQEIDEIIRQAEKFEIEDEMDEEVIEVLREAAVKSAAYTKRWYDVFTDSFIHCPSLATTLIDYSLLEIAEELYGEELPMLYTVSLRAIACEHAKDEEEIPDYVFKLATEGEPTDM